MKFKVQRDKSKDIEIYEFSFIESKSAGVFKYWKSFIVAALIGCFLTGSIGIWLCNKDIEKLEFKLENDRSTTVILRSKDE